MERAELEAYAREVGADVFGVANVARFDGVGREKDPRSIFPEARSVIVLGRRVPRGALRGVEEGTNFLNYLLYGQDWLDNRFTSLVTFRVSEALEDAGWEAVPLPNLPSEVPPMGVAVREGAIEPNVLMDIDDAAVRAGVGEISWPGLLVTPQFGTRQRLQVILTDLELEPTPILEETICAGQKAYGDLCPLGALVDGEDVAICGKTMRVAKVEWSKCRGCKNGATANRMYAGGKPDRIASACGRTCQDVLEKKKRVGNRFKTPLRKREAWTIGPDVNLYKM